MANSFFSLERAQSHSYFPLETFSGLCYHLNSAKAWFKRVTGKNRTREYTSNKTLQMLQAYQFCPSMALLNLLYSNHKDSPALKKVFPTHHWQDWGQRFNEVRLRKSKFITSLKACGCRERNMEFSSTAYACAASTQPIISEKCALVFSWDKGADIFKEDLNF